MMSISKYFKVILKIYTKRKTKVVEKTENIMNIKMIALVIIPIIGLIFIISTPEPDKQDSVDEMAEIDITIQPSESLHIISENCLGDARCMSGTVTKIIDGDTIHVDDQSVRFALSSAPELNGFGGTDSRDFIQTICPVGSKVIVDEDDGQTPEGHSRVIGVIYCNDMVLNKELLDADLGYLDSRFCSTSEFAMTSWAQKHGCIDIISDDMTE